MGIYLGNISNYNEEKGHITLKTEEKIEIGDAIGVQKEPNKYTISELIDEKGNNIKEAPIYKKITFGRMKGNISVGDKVYKLISKKLLLEARASYKDVENKKIPLNCSVTIKKNTPIQMHLYCANSKETPEAYKGVTIDVKSNTIPIDALKTPINMERVIKQISKTNNTPYTFEKITVYLDDGLYVPSISALNELRRNAIEKLEQEIITRGYRNAEKIEVILPQDYSFKKVSIAPKISLSFRKIFPEYDYSKLDKTKIDRIYIALKLFLDKRYSLIIHYLSENFPIYIYMPTIIKANYKNIISNSLEDITRRFNIKGFVVSNIADFSFLEKYKKDYDFVGNYSLNVFNSYTLEQYRKLGLKRVTISRELNKEGINEILDATDMESELIIYGNLPIMATNYCFLGKTNHCYPDCGSRCMLEEKDYYLKDRLGFEFRIIPDRTQTVSLIFNSKTLFISSNDIHVNSVRIDVIDETIEEINEIVRIACERRRIEGNKYTNGNLNKEV